MGTEIERKFLVRGDSWRDEVSKETRFKQGYLANQPNASVRVRIQGERAFLNIKSTTIGVRRYEFEYEVPVEEADQMLEHVAERPFIDKTRYEIRHGAHLWELDVFHGENTGLIVAEVELGAEDEALEVPDWAGEDVSHDPRYYNVNLVKHPYSKW